MENRRSYFDCLGSKLGYQTLDDFYLLDSANICASGAKGLLEVIYYGSVFKALESLYPYHVWISWRVELSSHAPARIGHC